MLNALEDTDAGPVAVDFDLLGITHDLTAELDRRTWQWVLARCYRLLDLDTLTRKETLRGI